MARISAALGRRPGNRPGRPQLDPLQLPELGHVMPSTGPEELISKFVSEFERVSTKVWRAKNFADLDTVLAELVQGSQSGSAVISRNPLLKKVNLTDRLKILGVEARVWPESPVSPEAERLFRNACFAAPLGFTGADFGLAETGSLVVSSLTEGAQLASLAPPVHVALVLESQIVASLEEALAGVAVSRDLQSPSPGRSVVFITGTSRTADIEQIVVRGVHGPQQVHAILIEDGCLTSPSDAQTSW